MMAAFSAGFLDSSLPKARNDMAGRVTLDDDSIRPLQQSAWGPEDW